MNHDAPEFIPTRSSLSYPPKDWDDAESWQVFFNTYWKLIYNTAVKAGLSDAEAQDVVQDTVLSVAKKMHEFKYDAALGSFKGWLLQLTRWRILNQLKKRLHAEFLQTRADDVSSETSLAERIPDPAAPDMEQFWEKEWQKNLIGAAIENVKQKINPRHYEIFHLHVVKKLPVRQSRREFQCQSGPGLPRRAPRFGSGEKGGPALGEKNDLNLDTMELMQDFQRALEKFMFKVARRVCLFLDRLDFYEIATRGAAPEIKRILLRKLSHQLTPPLGRSQKESPNFHGQPCAGKPSHAGNHCARRSAAAPAGPVRSVGTASRPAIPDHELIRRIGGWQLW